MERSEIERMPVDELWSLHEAISEVLAARLAAEKFELEKRLAQLRGQPPTQHQRKPYPPVLPRFRNPNDPSQTWAGRGRQPRWVAEQLRAGKRMEDFKIRLEPTSNEKRP